MLEYPKIQIISRYFHIVFIVMMLFVFVNYFYYKLIEIPINQIVVVTIILGILSIVINIVQQVQYIKHLKKISARIYRYKKYRLNIKSLAIAVFLISYALFESDEIKILLFTIGIYLLVGVISDFIVSKKIKANILVIEGTNLINLNGQFNSINLSKIKEYKDSSNEILLRNWFGRHTIRKAEFISTEGLIEQINEKINIS